MRSLFAKTLYQKRFMAIGWFVAVTAIMLLTMSVYNSFSNGAIGNSLDTLPPALQKLAGDALSFQSVGGYISQQIFALRAPMLLIIVSIAVMVGLTAGEEERGLTETQLALPISRTSLLLQKLAVALTVVAVAGAGTVAGVQAGLWGIGQSYPITDILPHLFNCLLVAVGYGLVGFAVAAAGGRRGLALGVSGGLAFLGFLINSMASSVQLLADLDRFTLFRYYAISGGYNWRYLGLLSAIALVLVVFSLVTFGRRDIRSR